MHRSSHEAAEMGAKFLHMHDGEHQWDVGWALCLVEVPLLPAALSAGCKYIAGNKPPYSAYVDFEKAFNCVSKKVLWWALKGLGVDEWAVLVIIGMYSNACRVWSKGQYNEEFGVIVVHQDSALCSLLFTLVCWKRFHVSSTLLCYGSFSTLVTSCS